MAIAIDSNVILYTFDDDALEKQGTARAILRSGKQAGIAVLLKVLGEGVRGTNSLVVHGVFAARYGVMQHSYRFIFGMRKSWQPLPNTAAVHC